MNNMYGNIGNVQLDTHTGNAFAINSTSEYPYSPNEPLIPMAPLIPMGIFADQYVSGMANTAEYFSSSDEPLNATGPNAYQQVPGMIEPFAYQHVPGMLEPYAHQHVHDTRKSLRRSFDRV